MMISHSTIRHLLFSVAIAGCLFSAGMEPLYPQTERIVLPDLGASSDQLFSDAEERSYARQLIFQLRQFGLLV